MKKILQLTLILSFMLSSLMVNAQTGNPGDGDPFKHTAGSTHTFKVNVGDPQHVGNTYTWLVYQADANGNNVDLLPAPDGNDDLAVENTHYSLPGGTNSAMDLNELPIQWLQLGNYLVEVAETNAGTGTCSTLRRIHISVTADAIDLVVFASTQAGAVEPTLTSCNDMSGQIITRGSNDFGKTVRYFAFTMKMDNVDWTANWGFDYTITEQNGSGALSTAVVTAETAGVDVSTPGEILVTGSHPLIVLKVTVDNTAGPSDDTHPNAAANSNISLNFTADDATPYILAGTVKTFELAGSAGNTLATPYVITASPKTSDITID